jgi:hypothetical protein
MGKRISVYFKNNTKNKNALCERSAEFYYVKAGGKDGKLGFKRLMLYNLCMHLTQFTAE